jgi:hypothetical protein
MIDLNHCRKTTWLILLGLLLLAAPAAVQAQFDYATNNGAITLTEYGGGGGAVVISNFVTSIGYQAFYGCEYLESVTIPGSVTSIGDYAFYNCSGLTNVTISNGVTSIGASAFSGYDGPGYIAGDPLTSITIPGSVTNIGDDAFYGCAKLTSFTISDGVISIGAEAFADCNLGFSSITIPSTVTSIGNGAFYVANPYVAFPSGLYFKGNLPSLGKYLFDQYNDLPPFYYLPGATGFVGGVLWNPLIQVGNGSFGVENNQFGFNITGTNNFTVVVAACTNLAGAVWVPLTTNTLVNGSLYFSDPKWTNYPNRFYSLQMP